MSSPRVPSSVSNILNDKAKLSVLVEQFIIDLPNLDAATLATLSKIAEGPDNDLLPIGTIKTYLQKYPNRIRSIVGPAMPAMPYHKLFMPFEVFDSEYIVFEVGNPVLKILGEARFQLCMLSLHERWARLGAPPRPPTGRVVSENLKTAPLPDMAQVDAALEKFEAIKMPFSAILKQDLVERVKAAEDAVTTLKAEHDAELAQKRVAAQRALNEYQNGKASAVEAARKEEAASHAKEKTKWEGREQALLRQIEGLEGQIGALKQVVPVGGVTPADIEKLRVDIEREYLDQLDAWKDEALRPWMTRLEQAEKGYIASQEGLKLSEEAIRLARQEASKDLLSSWEQEPLRALPIIEERLAEVDNLVAGSSRPSPLLLKIHDDLRRALDGCRAEVARVTGEKPKTLIVGALSATMKKLDFDSLKQVAKSINHLGEKGVLTAEESIAISKMVNDEVAARTARMEHESAPGQLLMRDLNSGKEVDILVDAYNFMHTARQHFAKLAVTRKNDPTKMTFEANARAKLAKLLACIPKKFPNARVLVFLDGQTCESTSPAHGVKMIVPKQKTQGEGQADEEIIHYLRSGVRKADTAYVVSADKQLQNVANRHLGVSIFSGILEEIGS